MTCQSKAKVEVWGGVECSFNRVKESFFDQLDYSGHYFRAEDIDVFAELGFKKLRFPILWEKHQPDPNLPVDWSATESHLSRLRQKNIEVIAGLVHHGSGPLYVDMMNETFVTGLAAYAVEVAKKYPWINYYTPVNEPLTTARFSGLYGIWHPHQRNDQSFCRILLSECRATVIAMQEIRKINPDAKLVQTEDLGKTHSTPSLKYQADFENERRWLSYDLLCGRVKAGTLYGFTCWKRELNESELAFFSDNPCEPDIQGFNHYLTSERFLDEDIASYPSHCRGGNDRCQYADVEAVRVGQITPDGPYKLLKEAWCRYKLPLAVTEVHLFCTREEQMRWLTHIWREARRLKAEQVDIRAVTAWALIGSFGWNRLLTQPKGDYESGVFDLADGHIRPTALASSIKAISAGHSFEHPVAASPGWWQRDCRVIYGQKTSPIVEKQISNSRPLLITGKNGRLGKAFAQICQQRGIQFQALSRDDLDITDLLEIERVISEKNPGQ